MRISFAIRNGVEEGTHFKDVVKPGTVIRVFARHGSGKYVQVAGGTVMVKNHVFQSRLHDHKYTCYDGLYNLQKSQDNFYFKSGTGTKARIKNVLGKWKIPIGRYEGPDKKHGKKKYQNKYLSDIIMDILDDAEKKGGKRCLLRMSAEKAEVVPFGGNNDIYMFLSKCATAAERSYDISDVITRVRIVGTSKDGKKSKAEATLDGVTKYGIRQKIYARGSDESAADAKKAAQEILNESGHMKKGATVRSPDVPYIRKGDMVRVDIGVVSGYYYVLGIQHDAGTSSMTMELEPADKNKVSKDKVSVSKSYKAGDVVDFQGGKHYVSSTGSKSYPAKAGKAKITQKNSSGKHPYHLIHTNSKSNVYGWVDSGTFR